MRSLRLTAAAMAAALAPALATAGVAAAHPHPHLKRNHGIRSGACRVTLNVAPRLLTAGETALAFGSLACRPAAEAGQTVTLYQHSAGTGGFTVAGTGTTDAHGFYQITTPALSNNSVFYTIAGGDRSRSRTVRVAAQVTLNGPGEGKQFSIATGRRNAVTFTGTVSPDDAGAEVVLQRQNSVRGDDFHRIGRTIVTSNGTYAITHVFRVPGDSDIRVLVRSNHRNVASPSNVLFFLISQAQNPSLTINSSQNPIAFGGSTVISGAEAGAPNTEVTLLAHSAGGKFAPIATAQTDSSGAYAFPAQSPATSTFYQVQGAGRKSAVLYEGVKYVLTASVSATTIEAGQPLTFSGNVTPAQPGHIVYLERQNASGVGFHVVSVTTEGPAGEYAIVHTVYTPGSDVFRIKVPGGPANGATASTPFTITVTPRTAGSPPPEPPGNSGLPKEGQV